MAHPGASRRLASWRIRERARQRRGRASTEAYDSYAGPRTYVPFHAQFSAEQQASSSPRILPPDCFSELGVFDHTIIHAQCKYHRCSRR